MCYNGFGYDSLWFDRFCLAFTPSVPKSDRKGAEALFRPNKNCNNEFFITLLKFKYSS